MDSADPRPRPARLAGARSRAAGLPAVLAVLLALLVMGLAPNALAQDESEDGKEDAPPFEPMPTPATPEHVTGTNRYPIDTVDPRDKTFEAIDLGPDAIERMATESSEDGTGGLTEAQVEALAGKLATLSLAERAFLESAEARRYLGDLEGTLEELEEIEQDDLKAYVQALMEVERVRVFDADEDAPNIPLNTASERFNAWRLQRPRSLDPEREDGPIELGRYGGGGGPPTFGGLPLALTQADLVAGEVDAAVLGAPLNMGSGWRDSGRIATTDLRLLGWPIGDRDQYVQINAGSVLNIVDYGDVAVDNESTERSMQHVREIVREIAETGAVPFIVGGDHSLSYPNVAALADVYGKEQVSVIHFDSHYDAWWGWDAHLIGHGYPVYRLINEGHVRAADYIQMGLRASGPDKSGFRWMREQGMRFHTMAEIERRGWDAVLDRVVAEASEDGRKLHISFDIDVLDPAFTVGTGTPVPGGLTMREGISIVRRLCAESNVVGFDLVELHPYLDPTYQTTLASAHIIKACLTGLAMNREGLTDPHYLSPLASEHALDDYYGDQQSFLDATEAEEASEEASEEEAGAENRDRDAGNEAPYAAGSESEARDSER